MLGFLSLHVVGEVLRCPETVNDVLWLLPTQPCLDRVFRTSGILVR